MKGHNNDAGTFHLTGLAAYLEEHNYLVLCDGAYGGPNTITPDDASTNSLLGMQKLQRSVVEVVIGLTKMNAAAALKFTQPPELQTISLFVCYQLSAGRSECARPHH